MSGPSQILSLDDEARRGNPGFAMETPDSIFGVAAWLAGGLGLFLYGIDLMSQALRKAAGGGLRRVFYQVSRNPLRGMAAGAVTTALVQSSSATTVMVVGFINAGMMPFRQSIGIILGANLGGTITPQIATLNIEALALPLLGIGFVVYFLSKRRVLRHAGLACMGFGMLFFGLLLMKGSVAGYQEPIRSWFEARAGGGTGGYWMAFLVATALTMGIQSSAATVVLVQSLGLPGIDMAIPLLLGAQVGTCATAVLASLHACRSAKRAALAHVVFNLLGAALTAALFPFYVWLTPLTADGMAHQIANAHVLIKLVDVLVFLPLSAPLAWLVERMLPGEDDVSVAPRFLAPDDPDNPPVALEHVRLELLRLGNIGLDALRDAVLGFVDRNEALQGRVLRQEEAMDDLSRMVAQAVTETARLPLPPELNRQPPLLLHVLGDIERIGDHAENVVELAQAYCAPQARFSSQAAAEILGLLDELLGLGRLAMLAVEDRKPDLAPAVMAAKDRVHARVDELFDRHDARVAAGTCSSLAGIAFVELVTNLRRVANHLRNIGVSMALQTPERVNVATPANS